MQNNIVENLPIFRKVFLCFDTYVKIYITFLFVENTPLVSLSYLKVPFKAIDKFFTGCIIQKANSSHTKYLRANNMEGSHG
ncbi:hypothetical protein EIP09_06520 [Listeria monocytogenes]|nr:hypothetical protein [Listeria monocytogenes]KHK37461.1 hypothetical protein I622_00330 [Listeria monocytogenes SHL013]EAA0405860.1 hypothetical protein [Listeria monocytogenes]EAC2210361.1 hypothetical protein [Listeria monocytogenes]EAC2300688.1 hypothetical protein [Listeria monocytogenes]